MPSNQPPSSAPAHVKGLSKLMPWLEVGKRALISEGSVVRLYQQVELI
jgi:hypothetical protein